MDQIVSAISNCLPVGLLSRHLCYVVSCLPFFDSLSREMNELTGKKGDVERKVDRADREGRVPMDSVKWWLNQVGELQTKTEAIRVGLSSRPTLYEDCKQHILLRYSLNKEADELLQEARELKGKGDFNEVADESAPVKFIYMPSVPNAVGMGSVLERLHALVNDDDVGVIGIHGMGGVGKTALLRTFHNEYVVARAADFNMVVWVDVTKDGDEKSVQEAIKDRLQLSWREKKLPTERAAILRNALQKTNNFVVFLDDMWKPLDLRAIGIPTPISGSKQKIILATRKENVCGSTGASTSIGATATTVKIDCLAWKDSWSLFTAMAAGGEDRIKESHPDVQRHAEKLARKCGGLPLALTHVGRAMFGRTTRDEWRRSWSMMDITPWHLPGTADNVLKPLELSYDDLSDHKMRTFLLYSSLFPNDHRVGKESVIKYGIGEGIIDVFSPVVELDTGIYEEGHYLIGNIKTASSLIAYDHDDDDYMKMHPMVRAMVSWISCDHGTNPRKWLVAADLGVREAFLQAEYWKDAKWISLMDNDIQALPESPNSPTLEVLLLQENKKLTIPRDLFLHMPALRVLDLSFTAIEEFPPGIEELVSLRYLNLSNTKITSIPAGLKALSQLRVLLLSFTPLESIAEGVIASLTQLRVLNMDVSYGRLKGERVGSAVSLEELKTLSHLKSIGITVATLDCLQMISQSSRLVRYLRELTVIYGEWLSTEVRLPFNLPGAKDMVGLHKLRIFNSNKLKKVIIGCSGCCRDFNLRSLPTLQVLVLDALAEAKFISWKGRALQNLGKLNVFSCRSMEQLIDYEGATQEEIKGGGGGGLALQGDFIPFPNLKEIWLDNLPELRMLISARGINACNFPSLERLKVLDCPKLKKLGLDGAEKMKVIEGQKAWWDALEWDDGSLARSSHLFRVYK